MRIIMRIVPEPPHLRKAVLDAVLVADADLVVARAGAGTIAEVTAIGRTRPPSISPCTEPRLAV